MSAETYEQWRSGVLGGLGAPTSLQNEALLDHWAEAETSPNPLMRWNNPLNTTQKLAGSTNSGAQPGANDVQVYPTVNDGIYATVHTLLNGRYPNIVAGLRGSRTPAWYEVNAGAEFRTWGTGSAFLKNVPTIPAPQPPHPQPPTPGAVMKATFFQGPDSTYWLFVPTGKGQFIAFNELAAVRALAAEWGITATPIPLNGTDIAAWRAAYPPG